MLPSLEGADSLGIKIHMKQILGCPATALGLPLSSINLLAPIALGHVRFGDWFARLWEALNPSA